jgi:hypothetical protein
VIVWLGKEFEREAGPAVKSILLYFSGNRWSRQTEKSAYIISQVPQHGREKT